MPELIEITTKFCHPQMNFGGEGGCDDITLKIPVAEVEKLQSVGVSSNSNPPEIDYGVSAQFWSFAFTSVLFLWLFAKGIGAILKFVRNA